VGIGDKRIKGMVAIAPPLGLYDFGFLEGSKKLKLLVAGDQDFFCPIALLESWFERLEEPKSLAIIEGADHFFFAHHPQLIEPLREFFKSI
jgi:alpha/beta superfamily hydrolase